MSLAILYQNLPEVEDCCVDDGGGDGLSLSAAAMMDIAFQEAQTGLVEGGIPIGAALFTTDGVLLGRGRKRRADCSRVITHYMPRLSLLLRRAVCSTSVPRSW